MSGQTLRGLQTVNYTKLPNGAYLAFGPDVAPQVHLLSASTQAGYQEAVVFAQRSSDPDKYVGDVHARYFGNRGLTSIVPAWSRDAMQLIATEYVGAWQTEVRGLAAAIALGRTFSRDTAPKGGHDSEGGTKVPADTPKPPKGPKGGARVSAFDTLKQPTGV